MPWTIRVAISVGKVPEKSSPGRYPKLVVGLEVALTQGTKVPSSCQVRGQAAQLGKMDPASFAPWLGLGRLDEHDQRIV